MAGEACMHQIEDEPVHELYSSLVGSTSTNYSRQTQTHDVSHTAYAVASSTISASYRDNHNPPTLIIKDDKDGSSSEFTSSSTFMKFYRGSCQSISDKQPPLSTPPNPPPLASSKNVPPKNSELLSGQAASNKSMSTKSTRSERRQQAKQKRDKQIQQERRIRAMLNSDLSEEDEALYNCLHR